MVIHENARDEILASCLYCDWDVVCFDCLVPMAQHLTNIFNNTPDAIAMIEYN